MGFFRPGRGSPLSPIDEKTAYAAFKASGSFDPDALYAQKEAMLAPYRKLKRVAVVGVISGGLLGVFFGFVLMGVAIIVSAVLLWRFQGAQVRNIEGGYARYVGADMA